MAAVREAASPVRLSVVVPTYRRPQSLRACLAGLQAQTRPPDEVVLVVRASDAQSLAVARASALPLREVEPPAPGFVPALRAGMAVARGDVVVMTDDDAVAAPDLLARYEAVFADPGVAAAGGFNQVFLDGVRQDRTSRRVGRLSWAGRMTGMHYARTGVRGGRVQHLQGCNMAFRAPLVLPDPALRGDGVYNELDMCLRLAGRGAVVYDERLHVDHHLAGRPAERGAAGVVEALAARDGTGRQQVADSCWNYAYVLAKNTPGRAQRAVRLLQGVLVGQRRTWGALRVAVEAVRSPSPAWGPLLVLAVRSQLAGWIAGTAARRRAGDAPL